MYVYILMCIYVFICIRMYIILVVKDSPCVVCVCTGCVGVITQHQTTYGAIRRPALRHRSSLRECQLLSNIHVYR